MLGNLQGLRAFAAICVMFFHLGMFEATLLPSHAGAFGVDLFFVISGFIIAYSTARRSEHFLAHRLIRILPAFWIATLLAAASIFWSTDLETLADWLIHSLLFLPTHGGRPVLNYVGWTLAYELVFYLLYGLTLRLGVRRAPILCLSILLFLAFAPLPAGYGPWPLLIEFAFGIGIYLLTERLALFRVLPGAAGLALAALGVAVLVIPPSITGYDTHDQQGLSRILFWGVPAATTVFGLVLAERAGLALRNATVLLLGAASYAIYLLHPVMLGQIRSLPPQPAPLSWLYCLAAGVIMMTIAVLFYRLIEVPMLARLRALLHVRPPVVQKAPA